MSLDGLDGHVLQNVVSHLLFHEPIIDQGYARISTGWLKGYRVTPWTPQRHFRKCGMNCYCCRAQNYEDSSTHTVCEECSTGWILKNVSTSFKRACKSYVVRTFRGERWVSTCLCGKCLPAWILRGWVCPMLRSSEEAMVSLRGGAYEWEIWIPVPERELWQTPESAEALRQRVFWALGW